MRIGIDISKALGRTDGIGRYAHELVNGLMAVDDHNQYLLYPLFEPASAAQFRAAFAAPPPNFTFAGRRAPAPAEVDLFHATTWTLPPRHRGALVFTIYDLTFLTHAEHHTLGNRLHCLTGTARAACRGARFVAISEHTRAECTRLLGLAEERIDATPLAAAASYVPRDPATARSYVAEHFALVRPYLLSVGTFEPRKNLRRLLEAFAALPAALRDTHELVVVGGDGWGDVDPEQLAGALGLSRHLRRLGQVAGADLPWLYAGARALAYPSLSEGFGLPPLEAMACGTPVITSNVSSLPEVVGDAAELVDPLDPGAITRALARVLADPEHERRLRAAGPQRAARFSWESTARATLRCYQRALADWGVRPARSLGVSRR